MKLLQEASVDAGVLVPETILVVPTLEPSWAVVFPRVGGVVAEMGGELSHASILLREAGRLAIVNCAGIFHQLCTGDRVRLDGSRGLVERIDGKRSRPTPSRTSPSSSRPRTLSGSSLHLARAAILLAHGRKIHAGAAIAREPSDSDFFIRGFEVIQHLLHEKHYVHFIAVVALRRLGRSRRQRSPFSVVHDDRPPRARAVGPTPLDRVGRHTWCGQDASVRRAHAGR
jgi:phosphohistidine swiveling domain-containing protein